MKLKLITVDGKLSRTQVTFGNGSNFDFTLWHFNIFAPNTDCANATANTSSKLSGFEWIPLESGL